MLMNLKCMLARFAAFLRKLLCNLELNNYLSDLNLSNLTRLFCCKLLPAVSFKWEEYCVFNGMYYAILEDFKD